MKIDWFTIIAQALNFLVLLWLMKRFLYKPILNAIDEREKLIAEKLANAEMKKSEAQKQKEEYDLRSEELSRQSEAFLIKAREEGNSEKQRLLQDARDEADALSGKRQESLVAEEATLREAVGRRIRNEVLSITRNVLKDLAGAGLEEQVVGVFIRRLHDLDKPETEVLTAAMKKKEAVVTVRTSLDLSVKLKSTIEASIKEKFKTVPEVEFESSPDLISGIEISVNGQKMAWSAADYLSSIEEGFEDIFKVKSR